MELSGMDCLIALDTLGVRCNAAILTIAMLRFDLEDPTSVVKQLVLAVDPDSNALLGRTFETGALQWWSDRPDLQAVLSRHDNTVTLSEALHQLREFYDGADRLWFTTGGWEAAVLVDAYARAGMEPPWSHYDVVCGRTLCDLAAWLAQAQVNPSAHGADLSETSLLRLAALREAYQILHARVDRRGEIRSYEPSNGQR